MMERALSVGGPFELSSDQTEAHSQLRRATSGGDLVGPRYR